MDKWDVRWFERAKLLATWSKDPSTQVGCVIVRDNHALGEGYNGFPPGIADDERLNDRELKRQIALHAEVNAIIHARGHVRGATAYSTLLPCSQCAAALIAAGVARVVTAHSGKPEHAEIWGFGVTALLFNEAGVKVELI